MCQSGRRGKKLQVSRQKQESWHHWHQSEFLVISMVSSAFFKMHPSHFLRKQNVGIIGRMLIAKTAIKRASVIKVCTTLDTTVSTTSTWNS